MNWKEIKNKAESSGVMTGRNNLNMGKKSP